MKKSELSAFGGIKKGGQNSSYQNENKSSGPTPNWRGTKGDGRVNPLISKVNFRNDRIVVTFRDSRRLSLPLEWYPMLHHATDAQRMDYVLIGGGTGVLWDSIGEALSADGFLRGLAQPSPEA